MSSSFSQMGGRTGRKSLPLKIGSASICEGLLYFSSPAERGIDNVFNSGTATAILGRARKTTM